MSDKKIYIAPSINEKNTFYIFRKSGVEVRVNVTDGIMKPSHKLTVAEANFFRLKILTPPKIRQKV